MKIKKLVMSVVLIGILILATTACQKKQIVKDEVYNENYSSDVDEVEVEEPTTEDPTTEDPTTENPVTEEITSEEAEEIMLEQLSIPVAGDLVATISTSMGDIKIKFFPEEAPKTVENFTTHAKNGYYDGLIFHRVMKDFMIQGGDPTGTGTGGESIWGGEFEDELSPYLFPYRGALCMANSGVNTNGSQIFLVQLATADEATVSAMKEGGFPDTMTNLYAKLGGTPWLYGKHTVFGQIYEGLDVLDAISAVETDTSDRPIEDVIIQSIEVSVIE